MVELGTLLFTRRSMRLLAVAHYLHTFEAVCHDARQHQRPRVTHASVLRVQSASVDLQENLKPKESISN